MSEGNKPRLAHLDGLRGVAALLVLYQHVLESVGRTAPPEAWARLHADWTLAYVDLGKLGVVIFFAISGYIVPFSFGGRAPRVGFVLSRFFRLYPAYWLSLAAAAWLLPALGAPELSARQLLANSSMVQGLLGQPDVLGVYWTLLIEVVFYGLCLALFSMDALGSPKALMTVFGLMLAAALGAAVLRSQGLQSAPVGLPLYLAIMLFGSVLRLATLEQNEQARRYSVRMLLVLCAVIPLAWATAYDSNSHRESVLADVSAFWLGLLVFVYTVRRQSFALRPLIYAGAISYSAYLLHPLALVMAEHLAARQAWPLSGTLLAVLAIALTIPAAHLSHQLIERPAIRWGRRIVSAISHRSDLRQKLSAS